MTTYLTLHAIGWACAVLYECGQMLGARGRA